MVMSQAMSCAVPVVCTENTGAADLVSDQVDGFVVPIRNVEALKERLGFLYAHRDRARSMGEAARKKVLDHFTWEHYGDRIVHQYSRLLRSEAGEPVGGRFG
jgi:glycosyltransferase involved in cell wall biosynthesis